MNAAGPRGGRFRARLNSCANFAPPCSASIAQFELLLCPILMLNHPWLLPETSGGTSVLV